MVVRNSVGEMRPEAACTRQYHGYFCAGESDIDKAPSALLTRQDCQERQAGANHRQKRTLIRDNMV